jgi:hypothetical protein
MPKKKTVTAKAYVGKVLQKGGAWLVVVQLSEDGVITKEHYCAFTNAAAGKRDVKATLLEWVGRPSVSFTPSTKEGYDKPVAFNAVKEFKVDA